MCVGGREGGVAVSGWERYGGCGYEWDGSLVPRPCMFVTGSDKRARPGDEARMESWRGMKSNLQSLSCPDMHLNRSRTVPPTSAPTVAPPLLTWMWTDCLTPLMET